MLIIILIEHVGYVLANNIAADPIGWIKDGTHYYYFSNVNDKPNANTAAARCEENKATLLSIADQEEQNFINSKISTGYTIGLKNNIGQGSTKKDWYWIDGTDYNVSVWANWENGYPESTQQHTCGRLFHNGLWRSQTCTIGESYQYICKKPDPCTEDQCVNGDCIAIHNDTMFYCYCYEGYTGRRCETAIDDCDPNPCQQGGQCVDAFNNYSCNCSGTGYDGYNCENDIDECKAGALKCLNGGTCINTDGSAHCNCKPGYTGDKCQSDIDYCDSNPCENRGKCIDGINSYICNCTGTGFQGDNCETDIDECDLGHLECFHNSTCINTEGSAHCDCTPGTTGKNCESDIEECESDPCVYGSCTEFLNGYQCDCYPGFEGMQCDIDINECETEELVCLYNSTCINTPGNAFCDCVNGTTGNTCEADIDECASNPCVYGDCEDQLGGFMCECLSGYDGFLCGTDIDECDQQIHECVNGTCVNIERSYSCNCNEGFFGKTCNETSFIDEEQNDNDLYALEVAFYTSLAICIAINSSFAAVVIYYYVTDWRKKAEHEELAEYCNVQRRPE